MLQLREHHRLSPELLQTPASGLARALGGPTLIHLPGERRPALFVSVLLHGNETVGWEAVRRLLNRYHDGQALDLPRALSLFIGNVTAAAHGQRRLPGQPDYNRVWPGGEGPETPEHRLMAEVVERMATRGLFASVDLHNNTGLNPHYACVNRLEPRFLHLAALFSRTLVWFVRPRGVQSQAMAAYCPAVTLECGRVGERRGVDHAMAFLDACLNLSEIPDHPPSRHDFDLFHTQAQVLVDAGASLGFGTAEADLVFPPDLDRLNFREIPAGTLFAWARDPRMPLQVRDDRGREVTSRYFERIGDEIRLRVPAMPSMLTLDTQVIRQDCLCYLMERMSPAGSGSGSPPSRGARGGRSSR